tara:strand:+ start:274 stop:441 length:168 start_codon:yes stop_codon:yes gene_type:complete
VLPQKLVEDVFVAHKGNCLLGTLINEHTHTKRRDVKQGVNLNGPMLGTFSQKHVQ